jgi:predicted SAM-dependent methyltransferase
MVKVNLGSGPGGIDGWINYDWGLLPLVNKVPKTVEWLIKVGWLNKSYKQGWPKFELVDIRKKLPLADNSVNYVYCSQVLEHFEKYEAERIAKEAARVLKEGGVFRVSVPDIKGIWSIYEKEKDADKFSRRIWGFNKDIEPRGLVAKIALKFIRDHRWMYDVKSMTELLRKAGFKKIEQQTFRKGLTPDLEKLDLIDHKDTSLYLEAEK